MGKVSDVLQHVRGVIPLAIVNRLIDRRADQIWASEDGPAKYDEAMEFLLGLTERADEVPDMARRHFREQALRRYMRYRPWQITRIPVRDVEWLTTRRDRDRPMVLSFFHHHRYDGMFGSLRRAGVDLDILVIPEGLDKDAPKLLRQHMKVVGRGGNLIPAVGGTDGLIAAMRPGRIVAIASDVPGRTPVAFLGREVLGSFGAARAASLTNSPVAVVTHVKDGDGSYLQIHEPIEPGDFADPGELLAAMLRVHEQAILAWPEALDFPLARFGHVDV